MAVKAFTPQANSIDELEPEGIVINKVENTDHLSLDIKLNEKEILHPRLIEEINQDTISFHQLNYTIMERVPGRCCGRKEKFILKNLSGKFKPGLNAIMGVSGSGKSTLLDIISGRKDQSGVDGYVLCGNYSLPSDFRLKCGYVIQDDILMERLTVRENISFSASLRLNLTTQARNSEIDKLIADLDLQGCQNEPVGCLEIRGISGGERKRTSIAIELINKPQFLLLDEPTTGLDSHMAKNVVFHIKKLADEGRTIIMSIHQPRYSIFEFFTWLYILNKGMTVYNGLPVDAVQHFEKLGYKCGLFENPCDFFIDVISCPSVSNFSNIKSNGNLLYEQNDETIHKKIVDELNMEITVIKKTKSDMSYKTSFFTQFAIVSKRTLRIVLLNPHVLTAQIFTAIIFALIVSSIYYKIGESEESQIQNRQGVFFFIIMTYVFGNMSVVSIFLKDRIQFIHESGSGFYRVSVYFLSKFLSEVFPIKLSSILVFTVICYWTVGLQPDANRFFAFLFNTLFTSISACSVAMFWSATVSNYTIGSLLTALIWVVMMVFSGLLVNVETVPKYLRWIKYVSIFRYSMNWYLINEIKDMEYCSESSKNESNVKVCHKGNIWLQEQGIQYKTIFDFWLNLIGLSAITIIFLIMCYIQLRRIKKTR